MTAPIDDGYFHVTFFRDRFAATKEQWEMPLDELAEEIRGKSAPTKEALPWLKLARFGETLSPKGSLRTNANTIAASGLEAEHDAGTMSFDEALERLRAARVRCLIYTSPSYQKGAKERWRVLAPFSAPREPKKRAEMVACVNGVLEGVIAGESFTISQAFLYGRVADNPDHRVELVEGDYVDLRPDLYGARRYKDTKPRKETRAGPAPEAKPIARSEVAAALAVIPADCSYERWRNVAAALWHQYGPDGFALFDEWSAKATGLARDGTARYTAEKAERQWAGVSTMTDIGIGTVFHYAKEADPTWRDRYTVEHTQQVMNRLREAGKGENPPPAEGGSCPSRPEDDAPFDDKVGWLLLTHGYCAPDDKVVELFEPSETCRLSRDAFKFAFAAWHNGATKPVRAPTAWGVHPMRQAVRGVRMRPDMPFPLYAEGDELFKNIYCRPRHDAAGGDIAPFLVFMERLVPEPVERAWLYDWMAHKLARPDIPGTAIIFVADNENEVREGRFGTGRGLLFRIAHALYGPRYARTQSFNVLDGTSGQSAYTDWMHGSVLVTVDESRTSPTSYRRGERSAVYDVLKDIVDPAPKQMNFKSKYGKAFDAMSYCSFWVATNHADAVAIPEKDRRFTVLRNGRAIEPAEAIEIDAWMRDPANIGALAAWLATRSLAGFNMFQPLDTAGKADMAEMARSEVEDVLRDFMADESRGRVFTKQHLMAHVGYSFGVQHTRWQGEFEGAWSRYCAKAVVGLNGTQRRIRVGGTQRKLFCFRGQQSIVAELPEATIRREAAKWGSVDTSEPRLSVLSGVAGLSEKSESDQ